MGIGAQQHPPAPLPQERPGTFCAQVWVGFGGDLDGYQKISTPPAFEPETIQPIASCYTDCAVRTVIAVVRFDIYHKVTILDLSVCFGVLINNN
jgi:hypothetical protein